MGIAYIAMPSDPIGLAAVRMWPTTDAGGVFAPAESEANETSGHASAVERGRHVHIGDESLVVVPQNSTPMAAELGDAQ